MIQVNRNSTLVNGLTAAYSKEMPRVGDTVAVMNHDREGNAIVINTTMMGGNLHLIYLDVNWSSFERFPDGE